MDEASQKRLQTLLAKTPEQLTEDDIAFLRARQSYLKKIDLEEFASVLTPVTNQTSEEETVNIHGKKSK